MRLVTMLMVLMVTACGGQDGSNNRSGPAGPSGEDGPTGKDGNDGTNGVDGEDGKDFTPVADADLEAYWMLPNGGYLEFLKDSDGRYLVNGTQRIYAVNPDDSSLATYLALAVGPYTAHDGVIRTEFIATYVAATHNVHVGNTAVQIVGARKTVATFSLNSAGKLVINMKVYGATGLTIEADRTIVSE